jgi:hypothetical protein
VEAELHDFLAIAMDGSNPPPPGTSYPTSNGHVGIRSGMDVLGEQKYLSQNLTNY